MDAIVRNFDDIALCDGSEVSEGLFESINTIQTPSMSLVKDTPTLPWGLKFRGNPPFVPAA